MTDISILVDIIQWILAFLILFFTDIFWALYINKVKDGKPVQAGLWAVALFVAGAFAVVGYTNNHWLIIPAAIGAFSGTFIAVWWEKRNKK